MEEKKEINNVAARINDVKIISDGEINNLLNDDCLHEVFQYLRPDERIRIERVCKRWQLVGKSSWNKFTFLNTKTLNPFIKTYTSGRICSAYYNILTRGGFFLNEIYIDIAYIGTYKTKRDEISEIFHLFSTFCKNIKILTIEHDFAASDGFLLGDHTDPYLANVLKQIFLNNRNLKSLKCTCVDVLGDCLLSLPFDSIESIHLKIEWVNENNLRETFKKLKNLKSCVIISEENKIFEIILKEISHDNNKIDYLFFELIYDFSRDCYSKVDINFSPYFARLKNLKTVEFRNMFLSELDLMSYGYSSDKLILSCISNFISLKRIDYMVYNGIKNECYEKIMNCKNIKITKLGNGVSNEGTLIIATVPSFPALEELFLGYSTMIFDGIKEFNYINKFKAHGLLNFFKNAKNLEFFNITLTDLELNDNDVREAVMSNNNISKIKIIIGSLVIEIIK